MANSLKITLVVCIVTAVVLVAALVAGIILDSKGLLPFGSANRKAYSGTDDYTLGGGEIPADGITRLDIGWVRGKVVVSVDPTATAITFSETGTTDKHTLCYQNKDGVLSLRYTQNRLPVFNTALVPKKTLTVTLPAEFVSGEMVLHSMAADLSLESVHLRALTLDKASGDVTLRSCGIDANCKIDSASGRTELDHITVGATLRVESASGGICIKDCTLASDCSIESDSGNVDMLRTSVGGNCEIEKASGTATLRTLQVTGDLEVESDSGKLDGSGVGARNITVSSSSGGILFSDTVCGALSLDCASGGITFSGQAQTVRQDISSGGAEYRFTVAPTSMDIESVSGDVTLYLPAGTGVEADYSGTSGHLLCNVEGAVHGNYCSIAPAAEGTLCTIRAEAVSGNLIIRMQ